MKWFYTEGKLTVRSKQQERNFLLDDLILETAQRSSLIKTVVMVFTIVLALLCFLQFVITSFPSEQSIYFYVGYVATPLFIASIVSLFILVVMILGLGYGGLTVLKEVQKVQLSPRSKMLTTNQIVAHPSSTKNIGFPFITARISS